MARYFDIHPENPQRRSIGQVVDLLREDGLIAYPTDSCYALGCQLGNRDGIDRIRTPTVFLRGCSSRRGTSFVAGRMKV